MSVITKLMKNLWKNTVGLAVLVLISGVLGTQWKPDQNTDVSPIEELSASTEESWWRDHMAPLPPSALVPEVGRTYVHVGVVADLSCVWNHRHLELADFCDELRNIRSSKPCERLDVIAHPGPGLAVGEWSAVEPFFKAVEQVLGAGHCSFEKYQTAPSKSIKTSRP